MAGLAKLCRKDRASASRSLSPATCDFTYLEINLNLSVICVLTACCREDRARVEEGRLRGVGGMAGQQERVRGWCSTVQYSSVQGGTVQYSSVQCSTVQYSSVQCSTVQYSSVQCSTLQYSSVQCSTVENITSH